VKAAAAFFALMFAPAIVCQTVSEVHGNIVFNDADGRSSEITSDHMDSEPNLCHDHRKIVFIRSTPSRKTDTGLGDMELTEIWIAQTDGKQPPRRLLVGHEGGFVPGPNMVMAGLEEPQFSPDCQRVYFSATTWATSVAFYVLDLKTGQTKFLYAGLGIEVVQSGKYKGFLIATKDPIIEDRGRTAVYWLLGPDGSEVKRIGETEADLARFWQTMR
jgi:Tol biopolymer transport system component